MLFNSLEFAVFLPIVFILYWFLINKNLKLQNSLLLISSYIFYGWWDWRFLSLIVLSTTLDFSIGILLGKCKENKTRKAILTISFITNLGLLGFFKYFNFFIDSFLDLSESLGFQANEMSLKIILPVGISFYTFQSLSYTVDVFKGKLQPTKDPIAFFAYVSFFPQLVAGPIERATNLLPQFYKTRTFNYRKAVDGLRQMLWGFFKKIVIADNCAPFVNDIFSNSDGYSGSTLLIGAILFAFQIYCDFSGYSDIAIGTARLFGFDLMQNFAFPYFSRDIAEFWRRWHISLSTWFRDYLYIPLGGSKVSNFKKIRNTFIVFVVSGFWHGANWTFMAWGFLHALYFIPLLVLNRNRKYLHPIDKNKLLPSVGEFFGILLTFFLVVIAWVFFRAENMTVAINYLSKIFSLSLINNPEVFPFELLFPIGLLIFLEWMNRDKQHALNIDLFPKSPVLRWAVYQFILLIILIYSGEQQTFIYFQF